MLLILCLHHSREEIGGHGAYEALPHQKGYLIFQTAFEEESRPAGQKVNFEGAGLGWAGHWRENCYERCPCREKGLCAWAVEGAWEAGGPGRSEPGNRKQRGQ